LRRKNAAGDYQRPYFARICGSFRWPWRGYNGMVDVGYEKRTTEWITAKTSFLTAAEITSMESKASGGLPKTEWPNSMGFLKANSISI